MMFHSHLVRKDPCKHHLVLCLVEYLSGRYVLRLCNTGWTNVNVQRAGFALLADITDLDLRFKSNNATNPPDTQVGILWHILQ